MLRFTLMMPAGILLTLVLLWLMAAMIKPQERATPAKTKAVTIDVLSHHEPKTQEESPQQAEAVRSEPQRAPAPPTPLPTLAPSAPVATVQSDLSVASFNFEPDLQGEINVTELASAPTKPATGKREDSGFSSELFPIRQFQPSYPQQARRRGIEGWVKVAYRITTEGDVTDIRILESQPVRIFDRATLRALQRWKFKPQMVSGVAKPRQVEQKIIFELDG